MVKHISILLSGEELNERYPFNALKKNLLNLYLN